MRRQTFGPIQVAKTQIIHGVSAMIGFKILNVHWGAMAEGFKQGSDNTKLACRKDLCG